MKKFFQNKWARIIVAIIIFIILIITIYYLVVFQLQIQQKSNLTILQNKCSVQAKIFIDNIQGNISNMKYNYANHYSIRLNGCYVLIHGTGVAYIGSSDKLIDVYNNKTVADCESFADSPQLNSCIYNGSSTVYNVNDFNDFIKSYMQNQ